MTENLLASGVAVVGATVCTHPIDVVKVQLQMAEKSCAKADSFSELVALWWLCVMLWLFVRQIREILILTSMRMPQGCSNFHCGKLKHLRPPAFCQLLAEVPAACGHRPLSGFLWSANNVFRIFKVLQVTTSRLQSF